MKYRNIISNGFASKKEERRWHQLLLLEKSGVITDLEKQVTFRLEVNGQLICKYICDFRYKENGQIIVEDVKGFKTRIYIMKRKLMLAVHNIIIRET